jgi:hypothetical protein
LEENNATEPLVTEMSEDDALAETRNQLTKTKTQYEKLLDSGKIKDDRRIASFKQYIKGLE